MLMLLCGGCRYSSGGNDASKQAQASAVASIAPLATSSPGSRADTGRLASNAAHSTGEPPPSEGAPSATHAGAAAGLAIDALPHYFPNTVDPANKRPLLLFLHGFGADGAIAFKVLGLAELGRKHQLFVVAPDGTPDSQRRKFWNAHPACCNFESEKRDHVRYLSTLVDQMIATHPVDASKVYVAGFSNGGFMAHRLACEWGERLRGIVSVAGAGPDASMTCKTPQGLRVLEMHGDADRTVFYGGGTLFDRQGVTYESAMSTFTGWGKRLGCTNDPVSDGLLDLDPKLPGDETTILTYRRCARGMASLWTVRGGAHLIGNRPSVMEKAWLFLSPESS